VKAQDIRTGTAIDIDGQTWVVVKYENVKPGKGPAYAQVKMRNVATGSHMEKRLRGAEEVDQVDIDRREMEYLYSDGTGAVFMDSETYDQATIPSSILGEAMLYVKPNSSVLGLVINGNVVSIELPSAVELEITETQPAIKGATATNQLKEAVCETGLKTRVPPFIKEGEVVRISTESGEYLSRVSSS
jgi:elongation factor P